MEYHIGERLKQLRKHKSLTLKVLSERTGLTEGYLSRIENSKSVPPIPTLKLIGEGLQTDTLQLLSYDLNHEEADSKKFVLCKAKELQKNSNFVKPNGLHNNTLYNPRHQYSPIAQSKRGKNMYPYITTIGFRRGSPSSHEGEQFCYVVEGVIELLYGTEKYILEKGDCAYFDSNIPHHVCSIGKKHAVVVAVFHPYKRNWESE